MNIGELENKKFILECLTPLHISGGAGNLSQYEYLYNPEAQEVYFYDEQRWIAFLQKKHLMEEFYKFVCSQDALEVPMPSKAEARAEYGSMSRSGRGKKTAPVKKPEQESRNIYAWLIKHRVTRPEMDQFIATTAKTTVSLQNEKNRQNLNDVVRTLCQADGTPYIPGSSIKGALRNGLLAGLILKNKKQYTGYWPDIEAIVLEKYHGFEYRGRWQQQLSALMEKLEVDTFHKLSYERKYSRDAVCSVMKGLLVSDALSQTHLDTIIVQKRDATTKLDRFGKGEHTLPIFRECITPHSRFVFEVTLDKRLLKYCGVAGIDEILSYQKEFIASVLQYEETAFGGNYENVLSEAGEADLILGGGTGFLTKTVLHALAPDEAAATNLTKIILDKLFVDHRQRPPRGMHLHKFWDDKVSPRTLKLASAEGKNHLMGLCRLSEV